MQDMCLKVVMDILMCSDKFVSYQSAIATVNTIAKTIATPPTTATGKATERGDIPGSPFGGAVVLGREDVTAGVSKVAQ